MRFVRHGIHDPTIRAQQDLERHVRDFFEGHKRRTPRLKHNVSALVHYSLPKSGGIPSLRSAAVNCQCDSLGITARA
jgi:hypothetical protein